MAEPTHKHRERAMAALAKVPESPPTEWRQGHDEGFENGYAQALADLDDGWPPLTDEDVGRLINASQWLEREAPGHAEILFRLLRRPTEAMERGNIPLKYAVVTVTDQTISYLDENDGLTTKHPEAKLWDDAQEASNKVASMSIEQAIFLKNGGHPRHPVSYTDEQILQRFGYWMEVVTDEAEFRAREDTW